ncbi:hypothetical protein [Alkalihalobacillus sp. LMS39]|uniref:hypothetical protein n=1 Tax=Alkalihalobacillus sp. LMS39 TaxID=2924032 RepID=UPI001FB44544|nr:hypothetical protein [Alkalihalobacillus sp. LMS39]UOE96158.1 hypothetical protein MM271_11385 [Alkalihalobacillus sp. LMS39]
MGNIKNEIQAIFKETCGTWQNCTEETVLHFLSTCQSRNLDPQYCMNWLEEHKEQIAHWNEFSEAAQEWVNENTASGTPYTLDYLDEGF